MEGEKEKEGRREVKTRKGGGGGREEEWYRFLWKLCENSF